MSLKNYLNPIEGYELEDIHPEDLKVLEENEKNLAGMTGLIIQNYVMIRQLDRLNKNIEKLIEQTENK